MKPKVKITSDGFPKTSQLQTLKDNYSNRLTNGMNSLRKTPTTIQILAFIPVHHPPINSPIDLNALDSNPIPPLPPPPIDSVIDRRREMLQSTLHGSWMLSYSWIIHFPRSFLMSLLSHPHRNVSSTLTRTTIFNTSLSVQPTSLLSNIQDGCCFRRYMGRWATFIHGIVQDLVMA